MFRFCTSEGQQHSALLLLRECILAKPAACFARWRAVLSNETATINLLIFLRNAAHRVDNPSATQFLEHVEQNPKVSEDVKVQAKLLKEHWALEEKLEKRAKRGSSSSSSSTFLILLLIVLIIAGAAAAWHFKLFDKYLK